MTKLWQKKSHIDPRVEAFTVGKDRDNDMMLAPFDVLGSMAHAIMLERVGLITAEEKNALCRELKNIYTEIGKGNFRIEEHVEDIHSQIEILLTNVLGDTGKKIHAGRSRNDQVLLDIKLLMRAEIKNIVVKTQNLFDQLIALSEKYKTSLLPGYTHLQLAMPSSFGLWFGAYAESLVDDLTVLQAAYRVANRNVLGSGAGYGSSFPLDRELTTKLLGFDTPDFNVVYAQMTRGKTERIVSSAMACIASTLGRMAMDICLYMNQNFGFISFPDHLTTGSSIMPHKKNPDVFEIIRGRCNKLQALPNELTMICTNLPSGYHRDMQITKEAMLPAFTELSNCLVIMGLMLENIEIKPNILDDSKYAYLFSVEAVNKLVLDGVPFRDAYKQVSETIENEVFVNPGIEVQSTHTHLGSIGNLANDKIKTLMETTISGFDFKKADDALNALLQNNF